MRRGDLRGDLRELRLGARLVYLTPLRFRRGLRLAMCRAAKVHPPRDLAGVELQRVAQVALQRARRRRPELRVVAPVPVVVARPWWRRAAAAVVRWWSGSRSA